MTERDERFDDDDQRRFFPPAAGTDPAPTTAAAPTTETTTTRGPASPVQPEPARAVREKGPPPGRVVIKVSAHSNPVLVAGSLANEIRRWGVAEVRSVGAGALNQAVKSIAVSRGYVAPEGIDLICIPGFSEIEIDGNKKTAITFQVMKR